MTGATDEPLVLGEWQTKTLSGVTLSSSDQKLAASLSQGPAGRLRIEELRGDRLRIAASSWVGVVRLESLEIRVLPKLAGSNRRLVEMLELTTGIDALRRCPHTGLIDAAGDNLFDLLALLLAEEAERIVQAGLLSDYVQEEDGLPVVRGRLLPDRQLLERFGQLDRVVCRYDEREQDVLENQLITAALRVGAQLTTHTVVRRRARQMETVFRAVCEPETLDIAAARSGIIYDRLNEHYRNAHELSWLILDAAGIRDLLAPRSTKTFAFLFDMNVLFERFVYHLVRWLCGFSSARVRYQAVQRSIISNATTGKPYSRVIPDLLIETDDGVRVGRFAIDAKYKLYDLKKVSPADIYQAFIYAYAFGECQEPTPVAMLVYPSTNETPQCEELHVRTAGRLRDAHLLVLGISIPAILDEIKANRTGKASSGLVRAMANILNVRCAVDAR